MDHKLDVSGRVQDYILARDKEHHSPKSPQRYGYEELANYMLLTSYGDPSTFWEAIESHEEDKWMGATMEEIEPLKKN